VTRDGLPRAYLRIDPNIDQHPDPKAMILAMCAAARQPERGRFREASVLQRAVGTRAYRLMVERGDVVAASPGPGIYLDGWDEWQEGDFTVSERMRRMRERRKRNRVTPPASHGRNAVTTDAVAKDLGGTPGGVGVGDLPPPPAKRGRRKNRTNPRAQGTAPRQNGQAPRDLNASPRQQREDAKRGGGATLAQILAAAAEAGRS